METFIFCLLLFCFLGWLVFTQFAGREQLTVHVDYPADTARSIVRRCFGPVWNGNAAGDGMDNFRPRLRYKPPILSVNYEPTDDGGCDVRIWASSWWSIWGGLIMQHAQLMWRKRLYVARKLSQANEANSAIER